MTSLTSQCFLRGAEPSEVSEPAAVAFVPQPHCLCLLTQVAERHHVGIRLPLPDNQPPAVLQHAAQLAKRPVPITHFAQSGDQVGAIECRARIGERLGIPLSRDNVANSASSRPAHRLLEHLWLQIEDIELAAGFKTAGDVDGVIPRTRSYFE